MEKAREVSVQLPEDPSSFSSPGHARTSHFDLDWTINFIEKIISGSVLLHLDVIDNTINQLVLDSRDLDIARVICEDDGQSLDFEVGSHDQNFGSKVIISFPSEMLSKKLKIRIFYTTSPKSSGIQWLNPNQTSGKKHPFLFSQCQSIHARSLMPCQDTPQVKATFTADVKCDSDIVVLMGALKNGESAKVDDMIKYRFHQPIAIPSYLLAIVAGDLVSRELGSRCKVWAEREVIEKAAYEFADAEKMLSIAEALCGPYVWQKYDILVLPPSFPYGGMENPCLTFVTPTLLAGDRSLADVIAHEICHSWTGNLITNCNWEHFWLNEGFTVFIERKIQERLNGTNARHLSAIEGWEDLKYAIKVKGEDHPYTCLIPDLRGVDPDDAYTTVPYEKGHTFLWYLEELLGGPDEFEPFLKAYLDKYRYQSIDSDIFKSFLCNYFASKPLELKKIDWSLWLKTPGMPPFEPKFNTELVDSCLKLCELWKQWDTKEECPFMSDDLSKFSSNQVIVWLSKMLEVPLSIEKVKKQEEIYNMSSYNNSEIRFRWLRICVKVKWTEKLEDIFVFLNSQGRMKFVRPLYRDLYEWEDVREKAIANFIATKSQMMHVAVQTLSKDLHL